MNVCYFVAELHWGGAISSCHERIMNAPRNSSLKSGCQHGWLSEAKAYLALWLLISPVTILSPCHHRILTWNLAIRGNFIRLYCASNRDYPSGANQRPWHLLQHRHARVATSPVRFDGTLWGPLRSPCDRRNRWQWQYNWDQSEHWGQSVPENNSTCKFQLCQANGPEAGHHLHCHTDPRVQWAIV